MNGSLLASSVASNKAAPLDLTHSPNAKKPLALRGAQEMSNLWETLNNEADRPRTKGSGVDARRPRRATSETAPKMSAPGSEKRKKAAEVLKDRKKHGVRLGKVSPLTATKEADEGPKKKELSAGSRGDEWWRSDSLAPPRKGRPSSKRGNTGKGDAGDKHGEGLDQDKNGRRNGTTSPISPPPSNSPSKKKNRKSTTPTPSARPKTAPA